MMPRGSLNLDKSWKEGKKLGWKHKYFLKEEIFITIDGWNEATFLWP